MKTVEKLRLNNLVSENNKKNLSVYYTAGFPKLGDTLTILKHLQSAGVDMVEIGFPFSDPIADGETIQLSSQLALLNGMSLNKLFDQLKNIRPAVHIPVVLMGYFNPVLQFGVEKFCQQANACGIDGVIIPDLPVEIYKEKYRYIFEKYDLDYIGLVTPATSNERVRLIDGICRGFMYAVTSNSTTGNKLSANDQTIKFLNRLKNLNLKNPVMAGFGIQSKSDFEQIIPYCNGAIIGTSFIKHISKFGIEENSIHSFITSIQ